MTELRRDTSAALCELIAKVMNHCFISSKTLVRVSPTCSALLERPMNQCFRS